MRGSISTTGERGAKGGHMENTLQTYLQNPESLHTLVQAAVAGDRTGLPEVRALLDAVP